MTKTQKDKGQRPKREFNIATSGQFRTLAMFWCKDPALQKGFAFTDSRTPCGRQASQSWLKSSGRATKVLLAQTLSYFERGGVSR